jgi:hypothetical protein
MMNNLLRVCVLMVAMTALFAVACDDPESPPPGEPGPSFQNLTERSHVLNNLQAAYNTRSLTKYQELLDANFTFFLAPGDVGGGMPEQWGRTDEVSIHTALFNPNYGGPAPRCTKIIMDVVFEDGLTWTAVTPASAPTETWYTTTVFYDFGFDMEPDTHYSNGPGAKVVFTVRNAGTDDYPHWQLVEMRDLGDLSLRAGTSLTETSSWGQVKALYR